MLALDLLKSHHQKFKRVIQYSKFGSNSTTMWRRIPGSHERTRSLQKSQNSSSIILGYAFPRIFFEGEFIVLPNVVSRSNFATVHKQNYETAKYQNHEYKVSSELSLNCRIFNSRFRPNCQILHDWVRLRA